MTDFDGVTIVFVPGLRDHVADHWQTHLAAEIAGSVTVAPLAEHRLSRSSASGGTVIEPGISAARWVCQWSAT